MSRTTGEWAERFYVQLMREINQERAAALGRVGRELERAWTRAVALSRQVDGDEDADAEVIEAIYATPSRGSRGSGASW
jgi:hypothetical protein